MNKKSLVVQSNRLVEAKYRLSVEEQKIIKILVSQIEKDDEDFKDYEFHIKDLAELLGMGHSNTYGVLRGITKRLVSRVLEFYDQEKKEFIQASWLSGAKYKEGMGTVTLHFDPLLKPLLLQLQSYFTRYELGQVMQFKGQYTIRFFEFRKSFLGRQKQEVEFSLRELREVLGLQKDEYKIFRDFKNRVLEPARLELQEKTGQSFSWEPVRQGKGGKVVGVRIVFAGEPGEEDGGGAETGAPASLLPDAEPVMPEPPAGEPPPSDIVRALVECEVAPPVAEELAATYAEPYLREKIALLKAHAGPVKSRAGFLVAAIHEDWKDPQEEERRRNEARREAEQADQDRKARLRAIKETFNLHAKNHALRQYQQVPDATRAAWRSEFLANLPPILKRRYADKRDFGFEDAYYRAFVMQYRLASLALDDYLVQAGLSLDAEDRRALEAL